MLSETGRWYSIQIIRWGTNNQVSTRLTRADLLINLIFVKSSKMFRVRRSEAYVYSTHATSRDVGPGKIIYSIKQ